MSFDIDRSVTHTHMDALISFATGYAKDHEPCIIFMDEIDAIGAQKRIDAQLPSRQKEDRSDFIICTDGSYSETEHQIKEIFSALKGQATDSQA